MSRCTQRPGSESPNTTLLSFFHNRISLWLGAWVLCLGLLWAGSAGAQPDQLLFGDTHLHSNNSIDANLNRNYSTDPATAYRYAQGYPVIHPYHRARVQIGTPLDFLVVSDHAEYLGVMRHIIDSGIPKQGLGLTDWVRALYVEYWLGSVIENDEGMSAFASLLPDPTTVEEAAENPPVSQVPNSELIQKTVWAEAIRIADAHNRPGEFTTLIGWEWSSVPSGANLHRVVFTSGDAKGASKFEPFSSTESMYPEDLWAWLDKTSARTGLEFVAIPHNSNISKGYMFSEKTLRGKAYTPELARKRLRWEPVVEVTQIKGDSETYPSFSPEDPFAAFEIYPFYIQQNAPPSEAHAADYVRPSLRTGLAMEEKLGTNPYAFGLIGSTDSHTGLASAEEPNFWGKMARDSVPENKQGMWRTGRGPTGWSMSAQGLAAVWAEENTRDAILQAFRRKEVYATTGPRIKVRVFGGWDFESADAETGSMQKEGYARGVPMGGVLPSPTEAGAAPRFWVTALKDPKSANLDRVQIIKGWIDAAGDTHEKIYDIAWSDDRKPDAQGVLPPVVSTVDLEKARYTDESGSAQLGGVWKDPDFDPSQSAFYYVRVIQIPTPRHSLYDALALGLDPSETGQSSTIQERAYTSPIWYRPELASTKLGKSPSAKSDPSS
ncbi:MAG: DUF3604 domain-containing protein [Myxococcota bacterium]|nr:DUF3604 domain-containing protein [Myxococcota bacterium]